MVATYGMTHVALAVHDVERSARFYQQVAGMQAVYRHPGMVQVQTPGRRDILVLEEDAERAGRGGGILHFGFRLVRPADIQAVAAAVQEAGGTIRDQGEFSPGEPYLFCFDPDGYEVEFVFEPPSPLDPPADSPG